MTEPSLKPSRRLEHYPGYPTQRFTLTNPADTPLDGIEIPNGPWDHNINPLPSPTEIEQFLEQGVSVDSIGRPIHPWASLLLTPENGGAVIGKGAYWNWGPNRTADPIVITNEDRPRILLIRRSDTGALALPGGFIDPGENAIDSAIRELEEETGLTDTTNGTLVYQGPVADLRTTLNAWAETSAFLFTIDTPKPVQGNDDATSADWYYLDELPQTLFGSHAQLVQLAEAELSKNLTYKDISDLPESHTQREYLQVGHMAYHHFITKHRNNSFFVKQHDATQFTDPNREAHSRGYLIKEHSSFKHLSMQGFVALPEKVELLDDTDLAMEHLAPEDGWQWRAPKHEVDVYIKQVLEQFDQLQSKDGLFLRSFHQDISPTYETFWSEGWDAIDAVNQDTILDTIISLSKSWGEQKRTSALQLHENMQSLRTTAQNQSRETDLFLAHNDARQSNIAWHPTHGVKIVDWSWTDLAPKNADATMFLIDLAKSGYEIGRYQEFFNVDYARTLIGFWLAHSIWKTRDEHSKVREHQIASAATAFEIIQRFETR